MFTKNPFILPVFAAVVLVMLFMFQRQQKNKTVELKAAAAVAAAASKDTFSVVLTLKDPIFGTSQGTPARCGDGKAYGLDYPVTGKLGKGRVEFDLFNFSESQVENIPLFALRPAAVPACLPQLMEQSLVALFLNIKTDSLKLVMHTPAGAFSGGTKLSDKESPPFRLAVEWLADTVTLFVNGKRNMDVLYSGVPAQGDHRLFLGQSQEKKAAEMRTLKLYLVP